MTSFRLAKWEAEALVDELVCRPHLWIRNGLQFTRLAAHKAYPRYILQLQNGLPRDMYRLSACRLQMPAEESLELEIEQLLRRFTGWGARTAIHAQLEALHIPDPEGLALWCAAQVFSNVKVAYDVETPAAAPSKPPVPRSRYLQNLLKK